MGAVAVPSSSTPWHMSFKLGWPTVPDKPENEMMGAPVERNSPDGWRAPNFSRNSQSLYLLLQIRGMAAGEEKRSLVAFMAYGVLSV